MTVESIPFLSETDARRLTQRIGLLLDATSGALGNLADAIREARDGRADLALGYVSWAEYAAGEFAPHTAGLTAAIRRELVSSLSVEVDGSPALSTRQIAPAVGTSHMAVQRDRAAGVTERYTSPEPTPETPPFDPTTGEVLDDEPTPAKVLGLDGKTYSRPEPKTATSPRRPALAPQMESAGWDLVKAVERVQRLAADDRFDTNKNEVAPHLRSHLQNAIEVCQDLLDRINH